MTREKWKIDVDWAAGGAPSGGELQQCGGRGGGGKGMANLASKTRCCTGVSLTSSNIPTPILVTTNNRERGSHYPPPNQNNPSESPPPPALLSSIQNGLFADFGGEPVLRRSKREMRGAAGLILISQAAAVSAFSAVPSLGGRIALAGPAHARCSQTHKISCSELF